MATIKFDFQTSGGKDLDRQFAAIAQRIDESEGSLAKLSKVLNVSEKELADLAQELGVSSNGLQKLTKAMAQSTATGETAEQQFGDLQKVLKNIKPDSFVKLQQVLASGVAEVAKSTAQVEDLASSYEEVAKSAKKAAKASSGITSTAFSKEASADRRNASEIARLDRQSNEKIASSNRDSQEAIAQADRVSAEKQTAARVEADKQIATIQANSAQDVAKFVTAQDAIQREKDRALQADIAAAEQRTDKEIARINADTAKQIASEQRAFDRVENASDRALQERVKVIESDTSKEIARIQSESEIINQDRERASRERISAEDNATRAAIDAFRVTTEATTAQLIQQSKNESSERIAASKNASKEVIAVIEADSAKEAAIERQRIAAESNERIAANANANQQVIEAFKAESRRTTAQLVQQSRNESSERIATASIASSERQQAQRLATQKEIAEANRDSRERIAFSDQQNRQVIEAFKAESRRTTAQLVQQSRNLSQEKIAADREATRLQIAELDRQQRAQENNRKARERATARQQSQEQKAIAERRNVQAATADASVVLGLSPQQTQQLADQLSLNAEQLRKGLPALQALYRNGEATGESLRVVKAKFDLTTQQLNGLLGAIKGVVSAQQKSGLVEAQEKAALGFAQILGLPRDQALSLAQGLGLTADQMGPAAKAIARLAKDGTLTGSTLADVAEQYKLNANQAKTLGTAIAQRAQAEKKAAQSELEQTKQRQLAQRADEADRKRLAALDPFAATTGLTKEAALELAQRYSLSSDQMRGASKAIEALAEAGQLTESELNLVRRQFRLGAGATAALVEAIDARVAEEKSATEEAKKTKDRDAFRKAQEAAALDFAQSIGKTRDEALALAQELGLSGDQMKNATKAIARLAKDGSLTATALADVAAQYQLNADQSRALGDAVADRVAAEKQAADDAIAASKQKQLADRADAVEQKRLAALGEFAAATGLTKDAALELAQRLGLTGDQMRGAGKSISALAESGRLTEDELRLVRQQYRLGAQATEVLTQAISQRVSDERDLADQQARDAAEAALAKAAIGLGIATGKTTEDAIALSKSLDLTAAQVKGAPAAFARLSKAGITGSQAIADLSRELGLTEAQSTELVKALQAESDRLKSQSQADKTQEAAAALKVASVELAQTLGVTASQVIAFADGAGLGAKELKTAVTKIGAFAKGADQSEQALKTLADGLGLNEDAARKLYRRILAQAEAIKKQTDRDAEDQAAKALADAQEKAALDFAQAIGKPRDQALQLARDLGLTGEQMRSATKAIARLAQGGNLTGSTLADVAEQYKLNANQAKTLGNTIGGRIAAEKKAEQAAIEQANQQKLADRVNAVEQKRLAVLDQFAAATGLTKEAALDLAQRFGLTGDQMRGAAKSISALAEAGQLTESDLALVRQQYRLGAKATAELTDAIARRVADEQAQKSQATEAQKQAALAEAADREEQKRIAALSKFAESLGLGPEATRQLVDQFFLTGDQMRGLSTSFNRLVKAGKLTEDELAIVQQTYRVGDRAFAALTQAVRDRVTSEQAAKDQQIALDAEESRRLATQKALRQQYKQQQAALEKAEKADQSRAIAAIDVGRSLETSSDTIARFAKITNLSGAGLKSAVAAVSKSIEAGTLDQDLAGLSKGFKVSRSALQFLAKRIQKQADQLSQQREAEGQAKLAAAADKADQERTAALSQFAKILGLPIEATQDLVQQFSLTGKQMKGAGAALDKLAQSGQLTSDELALVRRQFGLSSNATEAIVSAIRTRVQSEQDAAAEAEAVAAEERRQRAIKKELRTRYKAQQKELARAEKADQSRALAATELSVRLGTTGDRLERFAKAADLGGPQLRSAVTQIEKAIKAGTLDRDLAGLSKGLNLSETAVRFLARRVQAQADQVAANQAAQREAEGQAALAAAAEKADRARTAALSQFAQVMGLTIEQARDLVQRLGLTGEQMKGAGSAIDKLAKAGNLTTDELELVRQRFGLSQKALGELSQAIGSRVANEQQAAEATKAAAEAEKQRINRQKALRQQFKQQQSALEKAAKADQSRALASTELGAKLGASSDRLERFAAATNLSGAQLKTAVGQISKSLQAGTLDRDLSSLSKGLGIGGSAIRFLAKRIQQQADNDAIGKLSRASLPLAQALGQTTAEAVDLATRLGLTVDQVKAVPTAFKRLAKAGITGEQAIADLARTAGLTEDQSRELTTALQAQVDRLKSQKSQQQLGEIGSKQKADYESALAAADTRDQQRAAESAKQAAALGLSAEQTDRFAKAADLGAAELRSAVKAIAGLVKSGTATDQALAQLAPGLGLSTSAAKFLAKRLQAQADVAANTKEQERLKKEQKRAADQANKLAAAQARQLTSIGEKQRDDYTTAQANLAKELDKQRVAAIGFGQAIGTTSDRALRYAQALGLSSNQIAAIGPQIQKLLGAGDLQGALSLLTNTYKLSERSARLLIGKVEQRIQSEQEASDAAKQQAAAEKAATAETDRRQKLAQQEAAEAKKRIDALAGFAAAVGQTPDQALVLANVLKLSSDQMRSLPKAIAQLVESGNDTDTALARLGESYGLQDRQLQKLTNTIRSRIQQEGQSRLAAGADAADQARTAALPGFAAATGLTEAAARDLVTRFDLTGAQMALVSGEMARLAQQGKLTDQAIALLGQKARLSSTAVAELAGAVQQQADAAKGLKEQEALRRSSLQLAQALGQGGDETLALVRSLGLTADQVKVLGPKLATLARQGGVSELALRQLQTATNAPIGAIAQLATAIRANVAAQQEAARQSGLIQETQKLARALGLNADQALRFAQRLELSGQAIAQVDSLKKLYAQGPVSAAALEQFRQATGLAAGEFNRLAAAVRSRVALEQRDAADKQAGKDSTRAARSAAAEGKATGAIARTLDIDVAGVQRLQTELGKSAVELQKAIALLNQLEDGSTTADQKVELLGQSFGFTEQQARQLVTAFDQCKASARELGQNVASAAQDLGVSYGAALKLQQGLGLTSQEFEQAAQRAVLLRQAGATTAEAFDALNKEFGLSREQFDQLDAAALSSQQAMQGLATAAGAFSAALITSLKGAIGVFAEFDGEIRKAGVLSGSFDTTEGQQQFAALREEVQRLGASTQFTAKEVAETSTELVRSGFTAEQAKEALSGIVTGAIASGDSMQQLAEVTGAALNNFGLLPTASGYINDLVVATANASPAGVEDIGEALKYVGASAADANQPVEEVFKAFAQLASTGIKGSTAGTGLAEALRRLKLASAGTVTEFSGLVRGNKRAVEAFKALQLNIRDSRGELKPLSEILDQLREGVKGFANEDKEVLMNALFGVEGGRAIQSMLNLTDEKLDEINKKFDESSGAAGRAADQMTQGLAGALTAATSTIEGFQTAIGEAIAPTIEYLVRVFTSFLSTATGAFNALPGPVKGSIGAIAGLVTVLTTAVAAAAAFRAAATALGIAQGIAAAKTVALNTALALQSGSLVNVARALLGFNAATTAGGAGATGLLGSLKGLGGALAGLPATLAAAGVGAKALALGLGTIALQGALLFGAIEAIKGISDAFSEGQAVKDYRASIEALPEKFAEIEAKNPFRTVSDSQDKASQTLAKLKGEYDGIGNALSTTFKNISERGLVEGAQQSLIEFQAQLVGSTSALSKYGDTWGFVTEKQRENQRLMILLGEGEQERQALFDKSQNALINYRNALKKANGDLANPDLVKADKFAEEYAAKLRDQIESLRKAGPEGAIALKPLEAILKSLENRNPAIRPTVDAEQAKADAEKASQEVKSQLEQEQFTVKGKVELEFDNAKAARKLQFDQGLAREKLAFDQKADQEKLAFERQLNAEKQQIEQQIAAEKQAFESQQQTAKNAFESQLEQRKNVFETQSQARKDNFERQQEAKKVAFETGLEGRKRAFATQQQANENNFRTQQENRARAFEQSQQAARKSFEQQLAAIDASKKSQFDAQKAGVERQLQLEFAASEEERARLQQQFSQEDAQNARRQQLLAEVIAQEQTWEEQKRQAEVAFEEQQRLAKVAFDEQQRAIEEAFKTEQQAREVEFEAQLAAEKRNFEAQLQDEKRTFEAAEQETKRQFELQLQQQKQAFEAKQAAEKEAFEQRLNARKQQLEDQLNAKKLAYDQEQQRKRLAFEQEQEKRKLAFENAERQKEFAHKQRLYDLEKGFKARERDLDVKALKTGAEAVAAQTNRLISTAQDLKNTPPPKPPTPAPAPAPAKPKPRAKGGPVKRQDLYLVGEKGPELFTPSTDGFIVPNGPTRQLMGFAGGGPVRQGETIVVGERGTEAFVPANATALKVAIDTSDFQRAIAAGVALLDDSLRKRLGGQPIAPSVPVIQTQPIAPTQPVNQPAPSNELTDLKRKQSEFAEMSKAYLREAYRQSDQMRWAGQPTEADQLIARVTAEIQGEQAKLDRAVAEAEAKLNTAKAEAKPAEKAAEQNEVKAIGANVATIARILQSAASAPMPARRFGGPVEAGTAYRVGEGGPETFVPGENGRILTAGQSARIAERAIAAGQLAQVSQPVDRPVAASTPVKGPGMGDVLRAIGGIQSRLAQLGGHTFNFVSDNTPSEDVYATMRALRRAIA